MPTPPVESADHSGSSSSPDSAIAAVDAKAASDALLTIARNALGGKEVLVDPSKYLMHVCYDDVQGIAPRGVIVFSNGDDEFFSHETAVAPSQRSRGLYRNAVIGAEHMKLMETIGARIPELGSKSPTSEREASSASFHGPLSPTPELTSPTTAARMFHSGSGFIGGGVSTVMHSKADDPLYGNMGVKWQCVEFARRWLLMTRGVWMRSIPTAEQIWSLSEVVHVASGNKVKLTKYENGRSKVPPRAGDLIIYRRAHDIPFGHVAAIVEVGKDFVRIAEQNQEFVSYKSLEKLDAAQREAAMELHARRQRHDVEAKAKHAHAHHHTAVDGSAPAANAPCNHVSQHKDHGRLRPGLLPDDSALSHRKGSAVPIANVADDTSLELASTINNNSNNGVSSFGTASKNSNNSAHSQYSPYTGALAAPISANSGIRSSRHYGRQMPLRLDFSCCSGPDDMPMVEIVDEDPVLGWVRAECPLLNFHEDDVADTFRHILTLGSIHRIPLPQSRHYPNQPNPLVSLPWLDIKKPTDFFLKRSLIPSDAPSIKEGLASPSDVPDAYYKMSYDFYMRIRNAAQSLHRLAIDATWKVVHCPESTAILRHFFDIPEDLHDHLRRTLFREPPLGGRFDFGYDGERIVMMEYNCDSSAALLECCETQEGILNHYDLLTESESDVSNNNNGHHTHYAGTTAAHFKSISPSVSPALSAAAAPFQIAATATFSGRSRASSLFALQSAKVAAGVEPSRIPASLNSSGSFLMSKYRAYFRSMRNSSHAEALCPLNNTIHFMVDDDDEERYTALVAMQCAELEGFMTKMCVKLTGFSFYPPKKKTVSSTPPASANHPSVVPPALKKPADLAAVPTAVSPDDPNEKTGHGPCSRRVYDVDGVEVQLVWKTWSWDTVLRDHRKHIADKALAAANQSAADINSVHPSGEASSSTPAPPRLCQILINNNIRVIEPFWKTVTGSKAILPIMYSLNPTHDNMVCSYFNANEMVRCGPYLSKPVSGRAGQNITLFDADPALNNVKTRERMRRKRVEMAKRQAENPSELFEAAGLAKATSLSAAGSTTSSFVEAAMVVTPATPAPAFGRSCTDEVIEAQARRNSRTASSNSLLRKSVGEGEGDKVREEGQNADSSDAEDIDAEDEGLEASEGRFHDSLMIYQRRIMLKGFMSTEDLIRKSDQQQSHAGATTLVEHRDTLLPPPQHQSAASTASGAEPTDSPASASSMDSAPHPTIVGTHDPSHADNLIATPSTSGLRQPPDMDISPATRPATHPATSSPQRAHRVYPIFCAWMIDDHFGGIVIREDDSKITKLGSKVMPCVVVRS